MENEELNEKTQIKRKYADHSAIHVMEKAPVRNKVIEFVGKRYVTEEELKNFINGLNEKESEDRQIDSKWLNRNGRYFESASNRGQGVITLSKYGQRVLEKVVKSASQKQNSSIVTEGRSQIKRKYADYGSIRVNEKAPVRNKVIEFVGKRFVTETEMNNFLTKLVEERGKDINSKKWFTRNEKFFESFENRGQKVWTLSKYGQRVLEMIKEAAKKSNLNESIGLFKSEIFESVKIQEEINEGALAKKYYSEDPLILGDMDFDSEYDPLHKEFEKLLGEPLSDIMCVDSETHDEDPVMTKIYNYLQTHFAGTQPVEAKGWKNTTHGVFQNYDKKLNVIRLDDYGFVAFYFTKDSKF
jgi:hypothetical protein